METLHSPSRPTNPRYGPVYFASAERFRNLRPKGTGQPAGIFDQSADEVFRSTHFPPRTLEENILRGLAAIDIIVDMELRGEGNTIHENLFHVEDAMYRPDIKGIDIFWGYAGFGRRRNRACGVAQALERFGPEAIEPMVETLCYGEEVYTHWNMTNAYEFKRNRAFVSYSPRINSYTDYYWSVCSFRAENKAPFNLAVIDSPLFFRRHS